MKPDELKNKSENELRVQVTALREELFKLKLQHSTGQFEKGHRLGELRKDVARTLTALNSKQSKQ